MCNAIWEPKEKDFGNYLKNVDIPSDNLLNVCSIELKFEEDLNIIPKDRGGCYWIWTNEPVPFKLNNAGKLPASFNGGEIIYNGIAKDKLKSRIKHHLFGDHDAGWSGLGLDIYMGIGLSSHRKKIYSDTGKIPYFLDFHEEKINCLNDLLKLNWSKSERDFISNKWVNTTKPTLYFRNGINITESKHCGNDFRVYFILGSERLYLDYLEKKWREIYGTPKLCSYSSGK